MKKIKFVFPLMALALFSCDDYLDINQDPNRLTVDNVDVATVLTATQTSAFPELSTEANELGNVYTNAWNYNVLKYSGGYNSELNLTLTPDFHQNIWNILYLKIANFDKITQTKNEGGINDNYIIAAKICKVYYMQYIVDLYGDAPYTEAFTFGRIPYPHYNDDQLIYRELFGELDSARAMIDAQEQNPTAKAIGAADVMFNGAMDRWRRFANTIELKMLVRMSNNTGSVAAYRDDRLKKLAETNFDFISEDVTLNPGYARNSGQLNPFYASFVATVAGTYVAAYDFPSASGHFYKAVSPYSTYPTGTSTEIIPGSGVNYPNVADPRKTRIFRNGLNQTVFRGVTQGQLNQADMRPPGTPNGTPARLGYGIYNPYNKIPVNESLEGSDKLCFGVNSYLMTTSEKELLLAEAALRWPELFGDSEGYFTEGVRASFSFRNIISGYSTYIAAINTKPNFGFTGSFNEKLHAIMYQKWMTLIGVNGIESFIEYNRTGYPLTPLSTSALQDRKPRRLLYPSTELSANGGNVPKISAANCFADTDPSHPFWMLGDPALGN